MKNVIRNIWAGWLLLPMPLLAHICGDTEIEVELGDTFSYRIRADVNESEPSLYGVQDFGDPNIVDVRTPVPFLQKNFGNYVLEARNIGTTTITFGWFYEPNNAGGPCSLTITVVEPKPAPGTGGEEEHSGISGDPVNLFLGEFFTYPAPDIDLGGPLPVTFERFYANRLRATGFSPGILGINWQHNYDLRLAAGQDNVTVTRFGGQRVRFINDVDGWILSEPKNRDFQLQQINADSWLFWDPERQRFYEFNAVGLLTHIRDRNDNTITVEYADPDSTIPARVYDDLGREIIFSYSGFHYLDSLDTNETQVGFQIFSSQLQGVSHQPDYNSAPGDFTDYNYESSFGDGAGRLTEIILPRGNTQVELIYDGQGRVISETNGVNETWLYTYNDFGEGQTTTVNGPLNQETTYVHDQSGRLIEVIQSDRDDKSLDYDSNGNQVTVDSTDGEMFEAMFNASGRPTLQFNENGEELGTQYITQANNGFRFELISRQDYPDGTFATYDYDNNGNLQELRQRDGSIITYQYNQYGQIARADLPDGNVETYAYDSMGRLTRVEDSSGAFTAYTYLYNDRDLVETVTHVGEATRSRQFLEYHPNGKIKRYINEDGIETIFSFDANGELDGVNSGDFDQSLVLDDNGRVIQSNEIGGRTITTEYDELGRRTAIGVTSIVPAAMTVYDYDPISGFVASVTDPENRTWQYNYDSQGELQSITNPMLDTVQFAFDGLGRVTNITSAENRSTYYEYDFLGQPTLVTNDLGQTRAFEYDIYGGISKITEGGLSVEATRNELGEFQEIILPSGLSWFYQYQDGYLNTIESPYHSPIQISMSHGEVSGILFPGGLGAATITRNNAGKITERSFTDGTIVSYAYDSEGRLTAASPGISLGYDAAFRINESNGVMTTRSVHTGALEGIDFGGGVSASFATDLTNRITQITDSTGEGFIHFLYDDVGRLELIDRPNGASSSFAYDRDGLMTDYEHTPGLASGELGYNQAGQLISGSYHAPVEYDPVSAIESFPVAFFGETSTQIDDLGRVVETNGDLIEWNLASQVTKITPDGETPLNLAHNAYGLITSISDGVTTREFVWNYAFTTPVVSLERINGVDRYAYVHLPSGQLVYRIDIANNTREYYHFNESGHTLFLTTGSSNIIGASGYSPYGLTETSGTAADNVFTYSGNNGAVKITERYYQMGVRVYDAYTARFLSTDPSFPVLGVVASNPYAYAAGNPLQYADRTGLNPEAANSPSAVDRAAQVSSNVGATLETVNATANHFRPGAENAFVKAKNLIDPRKAETTADAVRALRRVDQIEDIQDATSGLRPSKVGKTVKVLKGAGTVAQVYGLVQDASKAKDEADHELSELETLLGASLQEYDIELNRIKELYGNKKITYELYAARLKYAYFKFEERNRELQSQHGLGLGLALTKFFVNGLGGFVPGYDVVKQ